MKRQIIFTLIAGFFVIGIFGLIKYFQISSAIAQAQNMVTPPESVTSIVAEKQEWPRNFTTIGNLTAVKGAMLSAEETGRVSAVNFESGNIVEAGTVLVELDTSVEKAELDGAKAKQTLALATAKRQRALRKRNANSQLDLDKAEADLRNFSAQVERLKSLIRRKTIIAPFTGKTGIRKVNIGQTINQGDAVVSVNAYKELYIDFSLPQRFVGTVKEKESVNFTVDSYPNKQFAAVLTAIESEVDSKTRNINLQASYDNREQLLKPGMFAKVEVLFPEKDTVIAIPASSISYAPYGNTAYVVKTGDPKSARAVEPRTVKLGRRQGDRIQILSGLKAGEEVVTSGAFKLRPGITVITNNSVAPGNQLNPKPKDS